jgi:hypothetical protein
MAVILALGLLLRWWFCQRNKTTVQEYPVSRLSNETSSMEQQVPEAYTSSYDAVACQGLEIPEPADASVAQGVKVPEAEDCTEVPSQINPVPVKASEVPEAMVVSELP